jgi:hypothetical protein
MTVYGIAPVDPGTSIVVEALDPATITSVECGRALTDEAAPEGSRFEVLVNGPCVAATSGNLRICWATDACTGFEFEPGVTVDLGVLRSTRFVPIPPDAGDGIESAPGLPSSGAGPDDSMPQAPIGLAALGAALVVTGVAIGFSTWTCRRPAP